MNVHDNDSPNEQDTRRFTGRIRLAYQNLLDECSLLEEALLEQSSLIQAQVYMLPRFDDNDVGVTPTTIPVTAHQGEDALKLALSHIKSFKLDEKHSGRIIKRLPGVIVLSHPQALSLLQRMATINLKKAELHKLIIDSHPDKNKRFLQLVDTLPNLVKLKAFRGVLFANRPLYSVGFTWKHRQSRQKLSKRNLIQLLDKTLEYYASYQPLSPYNEIVQKEKALISQYPATSRFIMARSLRVSPSMNLRYLKETAVHIDGLKAPVDMIAHSPLFVFNQDVKLHPLKDYSVEDARPPRALPNPLVIDRLCVYEDSRGSAGRA
ncbi:MAG: hypothetical protein CML22_07465 [Rheinheimera sp.]|nr:hypothetical protein [Rheinheimera sp.]MBM34122.1 hypothetical protein [Rheinheimera sp.]|tara:strand:+ start:6876 stop:7838 length:963 start_codon:yes stop_codon:yes gene_type:complete